MKATNRPSAITKAAGGILALLAFLWVATSFQSTTPADGYIEKAFTLDNFAKETIELTVMHPGDIVATAEWSPRNAELALILFGPGQMNYYRRGDGKSPIELTYTVSAVDTSEGSAWKLKLVNQSGETVEGMIRVRFPAAEQPEEILQ